MESSEKLSVSWIERLKAELKRNFESCQWPAVSSKEISKWTKGRYYCVQDDVLFIMHTNFPSVNHLDLEECSLSQECAEEDFLLEEALKHHPLLLDYSGDSAVKYRGNTLPLSGILWKQSKLITYWMEQEYARVAAMSLLERWDVRKFQRLLDYSLRTRLGDIITFPRGEPCIVLVMTFCTDSYFVVDFFRQICTRYHDEYGERVFCELPSECNRFFARHLKKTDYLSTTQEPWLEYEDLLLTGFKKRDVELVKLALEMDCPSVLLPSAVSETNPLFSEEYFWPRKKIGVNPTSFNSSEYYIHFTEILVSAVFRAQPQQELTECFNLIWRAFPVPYLPLEDMRKYMSQYLREPDEVSTAHGCRCFASLLGSPEAERVWSLLETFFEEDFPHEYKPRSLKHLSRYAIRQRCSLSERIADLPLPEPLKRYIDLEF